MGQAVERAWVVEDGGEGISIERHSPPTGHCRHTLHTANIVPIDNVEEEEEDRVIRRRKEGTSRQQKGGGGCPGKGTLEVGGQGGEASIISRSSHAGWASPPRQTAAFYDDTDWECCSRVVTAAMTSQRHICSHFRSSNGHV